MSGRNSCMDEDLDYISQKRPREEEASSRTDNSLGVLTKKFVRMIQEAENKCIDLNDAVRNLNVQKRRIYDITNVLEGIGLVQKKNKNKIQWIGNLEEADPSFSQESNRINQELEELAKEEEDLEQWTAQIQGNLDALIKDKDYEEFAYITYEDLKALPNLTEEENETLLAINAPPGTSLEVPDIELANPDDPEKYQVYLNSDTGKIMVYVVSNDLANDDRPKHNTLANLSI